MGSPSFLQKLEILLQRKYLIFTHTGGRLGGKNVINYNDSFTRWGKAKQAAEDFVTVCFCDCGCIHVFLDVYCLHVLVDINIVMSVWMSPCPCGYTVFMSLCTSLCLCGSLHVLVNVYMSFVNFYMSLWMSSSLCGCLHVFLNIFMSLCMSAYLCGSLYVFVNVFICLCGCLHVIVNV